MNNKTIEALLNLDKIVLASDATITKRLMSYELPEDEAKELTQMIKQMFKDSVVETIKERLG